MTSVRITTIGLLTCAGLVSPLAAVAGEFAEIAVKEKCAVEWSSDFAMQAFCVSEQRRGFDQIETQRPDLDAGLIAAFTKCEIDWAGDYSMQAYCLLEQKQGRATLAAIPNHVPESVSFGIVQRCATDWPADFAMQAYCASEQAAAWRQLNQ